MEKIDFAWAPAGQCVHPQKITLGKKGTGMGHYPSFFGVLKHPQWGVILYDTGYSEDFWRVTRSLPEKLYALVTPVTCSPEETLLWQLKQKGIHPEDVGLVIISHFHADHVCALAHFPRAKFSCFEQGLRSLMELCRWRQVASGFLRQLLPADFFTRILPIEKCVLVSLPTSLSPLERGYDLLGTGDILAIPLPGHSIGHTGLYFTTGNGREVLIVGDAVWHSESIRSLVFPHPLTRLLMSNWGDYGRTMLALHQLHQRNPNLVMLPSHCLEHLGTFPL